VTSFAVGHNHPLGNLHLLFGEGNAFTVIEGGKHVANIAFIGFVVLVVAFTSKLASTKGVERVPGETLSDLKIAVGGSPLTCSSLLLETFIVPSAVIECARIKVRLATRCA
jgi:hypothetical protein